MLPRPGLRLSFVALLLALVPAASPGLPDASSTPRFTAIPGVREFSGRLIVRPLQPSSLRERGFSAAEAAQATDLARAVVGELELVEYVPETDEYIVKVPATTTENELSRRLLAYDVFQYAEPDWYVYPLACPDDPKFGNQWHHGPGFLQSCSGWSLHQGFPFVSVGLCDTGVRTTHEDLQLHRLEGYNAADRKWESQGGDIGPINNHGTITTGIAAANGNNGKGVSGMGWDLSHRMLRVTNDPSGRAKVADLQHAARTSIESGDRVASISYAGVEFQSNLTTATYIKSIGGLLVWAAGNDGRYTNFSPRDADDILVVGATDANDARASFSPHGKFIDLMAPGTDVIGTGGSSDTAYGGGDGTSFSTPQVAGLCALIWSANPSLRPDDVELVLKMSCDDLGAPGVDDEFGYGRINVYTAMLLATGGSGRPPTAGFTASPTFGTAPLTVDFTDASTDAPDTWAWDFGDGATSSTRNPRHVYGAVGTYTVRLTVSNAFGSDSLTRTGYIAVRSGGGVTGEGFLLSRNADFSTDDRAFLTTDTLHMLVWSDQVDPLDLIKNLWELKDSNELRNRGSFTNHGDGSYTASFDLTDLASSSTTWIWKAKVEDSTTQSYVPSTVITVTSGGSPPVADFAGVPLSGHAPLAVAFSDLSTGSPTSWSWDFGDGTGSGTRNPTHVYSRPGTFTVRLTTANDAGSDTATKTNYVTVAEPDDGKLSEGFLLSRNANFSTSDAVFDRTDTLHMLLWSDQVDFNSLANLAWQLKDHAGRVVYGRLFSRGDGSYVGAFDLSHLPSDSTTWEWKGRVEDTQQGSYTPGATITVNL